MAVIGVLMTAVTPLPNFPTGAVSAEHCPATALPPHRVFPGWVRERSSC